MEKGLQKSGSNYKQTSFGGSSIKQDSLCATDTDSLLAPENYFIANYPQTCYDFYRVSEVFRPLKAAKTFSFAAFFYLCPSESLIHK